MRVTRAWSTLPAGIFVLIYIVDGERLRATTPQDMYLIGFGITCPRRQGRSAESGKVKLSVALLYSAAYDDKIDVLTKSATIPM
jgi:hypothetical protein